MLADQGLLHRQFPQQNFIFTIAPVKYLLKLELSSNYCSPFECPTIYDFFCDL